MKQKLCAIGEALIDFIPQEKGQRLKDVTHFKRVVGGAPANVAGAVAKLGGTSKFITQLGKDAFGDHIIECFQRCHIDTSDILRTDTADTALAFVSLAADGNRDFLFYRRNCADLMMDAKDIKDDALKDCGILHFCSVSLVEAPMKYAHKKLLEQAITQDVLISFDPNLRLSLWNDEMALKKTIQEFLPYADILKISDEELAFITGYDTIEEALPALFQERVKMVIYTMGKDGAQVYMKNMCVNAQGYQVDVKDTTGAGDSFIGAFLFKLLEDQIDDISKLSNDALVEYLSFANAYAAYTTTQIGALDAFANRSEIEAFISSYK